MPIPTARRADEIDPASARLATDRALTRRVLLTGATGYVGGRLLPLLEAREDLVVRCLTRRPEELRPRVSEATEVAAGDVLDRPSLVEALSGVDAAYYLVHSMGSAGDFEEQDRRGAENFAEASRRNGVSRLVYLGGLGEGEQLSRHLRSRQEVGRILRDSGVPTLELRASIVIGSGSLSYEMIRSLVERLPVMVTPSWVRTPAQPIAIEDLLDCLERALDVELPESRVVGLGGADVVAYEGVMREYARQRGLRRPMIPVPVLSPGLSSLWLGLVTPLYARVGKKLVTSLVHPTVVRDDGAADLFPDVRPMGIEEAIRRAREQEDREFAGTRWSDALSAGGERASWGGASFRTRLVDSRVAEVRVSPERAFEPIRRIGGDVGWYHADTLWRLRGLLDLFVGGVGVRRGRRDPTSLRSGDAVDFWRVEEVDPPRLLRLRAEMKVPGRAWLQFEVERAGGGDDPGGGNDPGRGERARIRQTAIFDPQGLAGLLYWYGLYPIHAYVFRGMLRGISRDPRVSAGRRPIGCQPGRA